MTPLIKQLWRTHLPCDSSSRRLTSAMSASATSSCHFSSANSSVRLATEHFVTYIGKATYYTWDYDPRRAVIFDNTPSLSGYYQHRAHFICGTVRRYNILRTSKPVSKLLTASCNPLSADEILSITVPIRIRCSPTMEAPRSASIRLSGAPGWTGATGGMGAPPSFKGGHSPDSGAVWVSVIIFG